LLAGCSFQHGGLPPDAELTPGAEDTPAPVAFCDTDDTSLILCYELEGSARDSSRNALDASPTNVSYVPGRTGLAAFVTTGGALDIAEHPALDPPVITIEAWVRAPWPLAGTRAGIIDNHGQYGLFLQPGGGASCIGLSLAGVVPANVWSHVACTYDGTARIYVDGNKVGESAGGGGALGTAGLTGVTIGADNPPGAGSPLLGDVDQVRMFGRVKTDAELCGAASRADCN